MKLLVLDGNSIINRAFYGIRLLTTKDGRYTNAVVGFFNILNKTVDEVSPDAVAAAFDLSAPTFRHKAYAGYKAGRHKMPDELAQQLPVVKELLVKMGLPVLEAEGFEADDILGTEAAACAARGDECVLLTGDRDSLQLVSPAAVVRLASTKAGQPVTTVYDEAAIRAAYGVSPAQLIEVKALMGDASDNIPGVAGVGEKTALMLVQKFGSLAGVYEHLDDTGIRPALRAKLAAGKESAGMSRMLAEIRCDAPVPTAPGELARQPGDPQGLALQMARLELFKLMERMGVSARSAPAPEQAEQGPAVAVRALENAAAPLPADFACRADETGMAALAFADETGVSLAARGGAGFADVCAACFGGTACRTHDAKAVYRGLLAQGLALPESDVGDTMLAAYLLNPLASSYALENLCKAYGAAVPALPAGLSEEDAALAARALAVRALSPALLEKLRENGQEALYRDIELPLARVLARMEHAGFLVDADGIRAYGETLGGRLADIERRIYADVGYEFNLNSPKQLGEALFDKLGLPHGKRTKTGWSTGAEVLENLRGAHPAIEELLDYRRLSKLKSTYTDGLLKVVGADGRIHSSFNQVETRTGRISSTEPNLQNIPVRKEEGRELRRFFVARPGCVLVDADYSQIELRILAHIAEDTAMEAAFNNHEDIHTITASQVFGMPPGFVTPLMRSRAKAVNFGIVYGIGAFSLSRDIGVSVKEADSYIKGYLEKFSGVRGYMERVIKEAHEKGYVETLFGRRRPLPELLSSNHNMRAFGERVARNTPIQGTAADIIKIAMVRVQRRLARELPEAALILQVHDELIVEAPAAQAEAAGRVLREEMEHAADLRVKLEADVHTGRTWFDAKG